MATALGRKSQGNKREVRHCHNGSHHSHNLCKSHKRATHRRQDGPGKQNSKYDTQAKSDMEGCQRKVPNTQDVLHILGINISNSCAFPPLIWSGWGDTPAPPRHQHCVSKLIRSGTPPYTPILILKKPIYLNMPIFPFQPQNDRILVSPKADKSIQFSIRVMHITPIFYVGTLHLSTAGMFYTSSYASFTEIF